MSLRLAFLLILSVLAIRCPKDFHSPMTHPLLPTRFETNESDNLLEETDETIIARIFKQSMNSESGEMLFCIRVF